MKERRGYVLENLFVSRKPNSSDSKRENNVKRQSQGPDIRSFAVFLNPNLKRFFKEGLGRRKRVPNVFDNRAILKGMKMSFTFRMA